MENYEFVNKTFLGLPMRSGNEKLFPKYSKEAREFSRLNRFPYAYGIGGSEITFSSSSEETIVFPISKDYVAKFPFIYGTFEGLEREFKIHNEIWRKSQETGEGKKVHVAKPEGIFNIRLEGMMERFFGEKRVHKGLVSQRLHNLFNPFAQGNMVGFEDLKESAERQYDEQKEILKSWGFIPTDSKRHNTRIDTNTGILYLIDFYRW